MSSQIIQKMESKLSLSPQSSKSHLQLSLQILSPNINKYQMPLSPISSKKTALISSSLTPTNISSTKTKTIFPFEFCLSTNYVEQEKEKQEIEDNNESKPELNFQVISYTQISISYSKKKKYAKEIQLIEDFLKNKSDIINFNNDTYQYSFPIERYKDILTYLQEEGIDDFFKIIKIPKFTQTALFSNQYTTINFYNSEIDLEDNIIIDYSKDKPKSLDDLPKKFLSKLYSFQKEGIQFGIDHNCRLLIADEMGVGKTIQALGLCEIYKEDWPVLIICPGSMKYSWKSEIKAWLKISDNNIQIINSSNDKINHHVSFYISSYDLFRGIHQRIQKLKINFVILDECHCIKNKKSLRSKTIIPIAQKSKRVLLLSGTPLLARPIEGFTCLSCIRPDIFDNINQYAKRYCSSNLIERKYYWGGASNIKELNLIYNTLMIRRLKKNVLSQLPPKRRRKLEIECDPKIIEEILLTPSQLNMQIFSKNDLEDKMSTPDLYRLTALAKLDSIKNYINDLLDSEVKFLVFAHHKFVLDELEELALQTKTNYIRIDGTTLGQKRFESVTKFQNEQSCKMAILSITAASTGITLTSASMVIFAELTWTPAIMIQAEDRTHRIGQDHNCIDVVYLYGKNTLDDYIFSKLSEKIKVVSSTLDDEEIDKDFQNIVGNDLENNEKKEKALNPSLDELIYNLNCKNDSSNENKSKFQKNAALTNNKENKQNKYVEIIPDNNNIEKLVLTDVKNRDNCIPQSEPEKQFLKNNSNFKKQNQEKKITIFHTSLTKNKKAKLISSIYDLNLHKSNLKRFSFDEFKCDNLNEILDEKMQLKEKLPIMQAFPS